MANNLARIFGTEEDKVNCSFYFKIGACRHGERCSRLHMKPNFSQTLLLAHFYMPPPPATDGKVVDDSEHYEIFYEDVMDEMIKFGDVEELVICENLGDHMVCTLSFSLSLFPFSNVPFDRFHRRIPFVFILSLTSRCKDIHHEFCYTASLIL